MKPGIVLALALCPLAHAQNQQLVMPVPAATQFIERSDIVYKASTEGNANASAFDLYLPTGNVSKALPVFYVFNGFGGPNMRTQPQSTAWAKLATSHGFAGITATTTSGHTTEDFDSIIDYLKKHREELHVDPERVVVIAWSGNVSVGLPAVENPSRTAIKAAIIYYGSAPLPALRLDLPVFFVRSGLDQPGTNVSIDRMLAAAITANAPWSVINYPGGRHGFDMLDDTEMSRTIIEASFSFAQNAISDPYQASLRSGLPEATAAGALARGDFSAASRLYGELVAAHSEDARLLLAYGNALSAQKRYKEARAQFDRAKTVGELGARDLGVPAAKACALDHDPDAAMVWLKTIPSQVLPKALQSDPDFAILSSRPDFQALFQTR